MPISKPVYQLKLDLDLKDDGEVAEDARERSDASHRVLEGMQGKSGTPRWLDEYFQLRDGGWDWRVAAYIAWAASPRAGRDPRTQDELARIYLGLTSDRAISTWRRRNPAIDEMVGMLQASPLFKHRAEIYTALIAVAVKPEYRSHNDRKLALELMGDYIPASKLIASLQRKVGVEDLSDLTEAELDDVAQALREKDGGNDT